MLSMNDLGVVAAAIGCLLSALFGWRMNEPFRFAHLVVLAFVTIALGIFLSIATGLVHVGCVRISQLCAQTTDTTIWGVAFPLMFIPVFWLVGCLAHFAGPNKKA